MIKKMKHNPYNDGILYYGKMTSTYDAAKKKTGEKFEARGKLFFEVLSARDSDNEQANAFGYRIDRKVKTHLCENITSSHKVKIKTLIYDVTRVDSDRMNTYIYLQLAGV